MDTAAGDATLQALLRGLGLTDLETRLTGPELAELVGAMLREATGGAIQTLRARALTKQESRIERTMIGSHANNPLKFFPDAESALKQMLAQARSGGYMKPVDAYANAFDDLQAHELAVMAGMRAALAAVLGRFDPAAIESRLNVPTVVDKMMASSRKAKMWDRLVVLYGEISREADDDFQRLFGEKFASAYEDQVKRMRVRGK
jgi:type VI secretion system FHA domain protein